MIVTYPTNNTEIKAIKAVLNALNVRYEITDVIIKPKKNKILNNIKTGLEEVTKFKNGSLETTSAKDFLSSIH